MSAAVLSDKDVNQAVTPKDEAQAGEKQVMSMEYHRQMLQNKMESEQSVPSFPLLSSPLPAVYTALFYAPLAVDALTRREGALS